MKLYNHQQQAISFILRHNGVGALFHDIGTGKTRTAIETFKELKKKTPELKMLVICPLSLIESAWGEDINKFSNFSFSNSHKNGFKENKDIYVMNYEKLLGKNQAEIYRFITSNFVFCVLDESSKIKNFKAKTTKILLAYRDYFKYRVIMTGTPAPNCETEYWPQISFIQRGIFHDSFYAFRNTYFYLGRGSQQLPAQVMNRKAAFELFRQGFKYQLLDSSRKKLMRKIKSIAHYAKKEECLDLPDQIDEIRLIDMEASQRSLYNQMKRDALVEIKRELIPAQAALTKIMKLRQITSGFILDTKGSANSLKSNPKLRELLSLLEEIGKKQVIIWGQFHWEIETIAKAINGVCLYGGTKNKEKVIDDFKSGKAQYLIAHPRSAGHGLTLVNCSIQIFYSLDYSFELYEQARGRTHRSGQKNKCTYIHLLCQNSIDENILEVVRKKQNAQEILKSLAI